MSDPFELPVHFNDILDAQKRLENNLVKTPVFTCSSIDKLSGRKVYFKAENLQKTGSFKCRGAFNAVSAIKESDPGCKRVVATSSGNHGAGVAWSCQQYGLPCKIYVPHDACDAKTDTIKDFGAELVVCKKETYDDPKLKLEFVKRTFHSELPEDTRFISTCEHPNVIAGQGTIGLEFLDQVPDLDAILVPVSGGGMLSGIALAVHNLNPGTKVYAVEPVGKDLEKSLRAGERLWPELGNRIDTIADGVRKLCVGEKPWKIISQLVEKDVITVTDKEMVDAMKLVFSRMKLVIEVTASMGVAAVLSEKMKSLDPSIKTVGVILCGGNADLENLPWINQMNCNGV